MSSSSASIAILSSAGSDIIKGKKKIIQKKDVFPCIVSSYVGNFQNSALFQWIHFSRQFLRNSDIQIINRQMSTTQVGKLIFLSTHFIFLLLYMWERTMQEEKTCPASQLPHYPRDEELPPKSSQAPHCGTFSEGSPHVVSVVLTCCWCCHSTGEGILPRLTGCHSPPLRFH